MSGAIRDRPNGEGAEAGPPICHCKKAPAGTLVGHQDPGADSIEMAMHFEDRCLSATFAKDWWDVFSRLFFGPAQRERTELAQQLSCVVNSLGGAVRFDMREMMKRGMEQGFQVALEPEADGHVTIRTPGSRIVLASEMPKGG